MVSQESSRMESFRDALDECKLNNLGYVSSWFTWDRGNFEANNVRERLDCEVANLDWWQLFLKFQVQHLTHSFSDHCPLLISTNFEEKNHVYNSLDSNLGGL